MSRVQLQTQQDRTLDKDTKDLGDTASHPTGMSPTPYPTAGYFQLDVHRSLAENGRWGRKYLCKFKKIKFIQGVRDKNRKSLGNLPICVSSATWS